MKRYIELPGVSEKDVRITKSGPIVEVSAETDYRDYHYRLWTEQDIEAELNNGLLTISTKSTEVPLKSPGQKS